MGKNRRSHRYNHDILLNIGRIQAIIKLTKVYRVWYMFIYVCLQGNPQYKSDFLCTMKLVTTKSDSSHRIRCVWSRSALWSIAMDTQSGNNVHLPRWLNVSERGTRVLRSGCSAVRGEWIEFPHETAHNKARGLSPVSGSWFLERVSGFRNFTDAWAWIGCRRW